MLRFLYLKLDISNRPLIFLDHKQETKLFKIIKKKKEKEKRKPINTMSLK
jgi:hypothetical protein